MCNIVHCSFIRNYFTTCVSLNGYLQVYRLLYFRTLLLTVMQLLSYSRMSHFHYHLHKSPLLIPIVSRLIQSIPPHHISLRSILILWHVDPLLGNDSEIINYLTAITRQQPIKSNREMVFNMRFSHCELLLWEAGSWDWGKFGNPEEGECPLSETATTKWYWRLQDAEKTWCLIVICEVCTAVIT
jgi:hypothetical protein